MKTTVDIADGLLQEARELARSEGTTLRALIEEGLRSVLAHRSREVRYALPDESVGGQGVQPPMRGASWEDIRALAYEDRL
ncbi:type II toxin-antitoxin system VapB family antitoxin [Streptosporangium sp. NPDC048047]|uniref:type II toxin-antitoxin system VapB family antitoxin n=1 Tax=Streptosporangium sp. NPDC048047 TaxID=3155748 RepID=UPI003413D32E